ncbi:Clp protease N-terminal domain-containing protein [Streptomyces litmocidini]|uniref:Clp protease N-terminal domain-containing protein n=1 Tax=Streptomyces litmocidini TaxID=67318 RepID=UPI0033EF9BEC
MSTHGAPPQPLPARPRDRRVRRVPGRHVEVDGEHLLMALLDQSEGLVLRLLGAAGSTPSSDATRRSAGWCRSCPARPRTTPC